MKQYESYFDLFSRDGWKLLAEDIESMIDSIDALDNIQTFDELKYKQGQMIILKRILNMPSTLEAAYQDLINEDAEDS